MTSMIETLISLLSNENRVSPFFKKSTEGSEGGRTFTVRTIRDWNNL